LPDLDPIDLHSGIFTLPGRQPSALSVQERLTSVTITYTTINTPIRRWKIFENKKTGCTRYRSSRACSACYRGNNLTERASCYYSSPKAAAAIGGDRREITVGATDGEVQNDEKVAIKRRHVRPAPKAQGSGGEAHLN
jgi:hypothetical protein